MLILAPSDRSQPVDLDLLPAEINNVSRGQSNSDMESLLALPLRSAREKFEREYLVTQLHRFSGNVSRVAAFTGMERTALHRKLKVLDIVLGCQEGNF